MIAGSSAPPETDATIQGEPRLVWRPRLRMEMVKMVGKTFDLNKGTRYSTATPLSP